MVKRIVATFISIAISLTTLFLVVRCESATERGRGREDLLGDSSNAISPYDDIMKIVGLESGIDWRLLCAIAYTESNVRADAVSERGATGLRQIMPHIGEHFGMTPQELMLPHNNVRAAAALLEEIGAMMGIPETISFEDGMSLVLASYNGGLGHVADARRLARAHGADMNSWEDVSHYLSLKNDPEYYEHEVVSYGKFTGSRQTIAYVRNVMRRYRRYCSIADPVTIESMFCEALCPMNYSNVL